MNADAILDSVFERARNGYLSSTPEELANDHAQSETNGYDLDTHAA